VFFFFLKEKIFIDLENKSLQKKVFQAEKAIETATSHF